MASFPKHIRELRFTPPYDWDAVLGYFRGHLVPYLETIDQSGYERVVSLPAGLAWFRIELSTTKETLILSMWGTTDADANDISVNVRRMFDLDADPNLIRRAMSGDEFLSGFWEQHPGLRIARPWSPSESLFGTVLGQLVSVSFGRVLMSELMRCVGTTAYHPKNSERIWLFPTISEIRKADLSIIRTSAARRAAIHGLAQAIEGGLISLEAPQHTTELRKALRKIAGIGAWTTEYAALRAFADNDAFPATDYALKQELKRHSNMDLNLVRPWRGYAAIALWKSFAEAEHISESALV